MQQDIVDRKIALHTTVTRAHAHFVWRTLVNKRQKSDSSLDLLKDRLFLHAHILGATGRCPLKVSQMFKKNKVFLKNIFLRIFNWKITKNLVYHWELRGNYTRILQVVSTVTCIKILGANFRAFANNFVLGKLSFNFAILWPYCRYLWNVPRYHKLQTGIVNCCVCLKV